MAANADFSNRADFVDESLIGNWEAVTCPPCRSHDMPEPITYEMPVEAEQSPEALAGPFISAISGAASGARGMIDGMLSGLPTAEATLADFTRGSGTAATASFACCSDWSG